MNDLSKRPVFTQQEIVNELQKVALLDRILAESGALTLKHLNDIVSKIDKNNNFKKLDDLVAFIGIRTNVFEVSFDLVKNHSQEFREMFGYLINFLCDIDQSKRNVDVVTQVIKKFNTIVIREVGNTEKEVRRFLEKHRNFFILCRNNAVMLNPACMEIPSAWERRALPTYGSGIRYDRSIVLDGIGKVVSAMNCTGYIKIEIIRGPWTAQTVFGLSKNVSNEVNLANKYPVGTLVKIIAYRAYEACHPWTATKVILADDRDDIWCVGETRKMDRLLEKYQLKDRTLTKIGHSNQRNAKITEMKSFNSSPNRTLKTKSDKRSMSPQFMVKSVNGEAEEAGAFRRNSANTEAYVQMNSNYWMFYNDVIHDEIRKMQEVDECLRDGAKTFRQIFNKLIEGDTFAYYSYMVDFIVVRSHLYEILDNHVRMTSNTYRTEMLKFLCYIDEKSRENITVNTLRKLINANDGGFMEELLSHATNADTFLKFIEKHTSLIELAEAFGEQFIFLRGTYISDCNIFVPKFHFPRSLPN
ncbi:Uncharacterized protein BM_BM8072 [Brugia malayi]|uniref:Bm8072 n=1 Tax=Brugia malayi TaxID=6279 RepID=A0A0J9XMG3_BRUMA|nr:Uncharacterized protein BM_BM8072 [Brugia malayi]CDP91026.1 Bm8072 [Brugia malayi]VIO94929.1 Uncharacterized protein BM_BM8072 [Brugia malayi]